MSLFKKCSKVIILPGNGCTPIIGCNWYIDVYRELTKLKWNCVELQDMPDPNVARETVWLPFLEQKLCVDENSIIIGHSSGALAAMRWAENHKVLGIILVAACHDPRGNKNEIKSGYYSRPWEWTKIQENCQFIIQLHSKNDRFIPIEDGDFVAKNLKSKYYVFDKLDHFMDDEFPQLIKIMEDELKKEE
jgi:predicted alpha/beta hydrolase family esterase